MLIVGSQALVTHGVMLGRKVSDLDIIGTIDDYNALVKHLKNANALLSAVPGKSGKHFVIDSRLHKTPIDFEVAWPGTAAEELLDLYMAHNPVPPFDPIPFRVFEDLHVYTVDPGTVLALKLTHRYLKNSPHFLKTLNDILDLRGLGYKVPPELEGQWIKQRERETYTYKHPSLNQDKSNFFAGDGVNYVYDHDDIHRAVAESWNRPAFTWFQKEGAEVSVCRDEWQSLGTTPEGRTIQLRSVLEESYVLALERMLIPNDFKVSPRRAFLKALEKVCTSITSGWWREYAWENYYRVIGMYDDAYVFKFKNALDRSAVKPYVAKESM